jgi:hypothetical protein
MDNKIVSAAVYFQPRTEGCVSERWTEGAIQILEANHLPVHEVAITLIDDSSSHTYEYNKNRNYVNTELRRGNVAILGLYSNPGRVRGLVLDWQGLAYIDLTRGDCFLGLPISHRLSPSRLLRRAYSLAKDSCDIRYGIGYLHERLKGPDFYAVGMIANCYDFDPDTVSKNDRISKWSHEMSGKRRYLGSWFRGAYPANLLSEAHVNAPLLDGLSLRDSGLGRLAALGPTHWLWELSGQEITVAEAALLESGLMICT